MSLPRPRRLPDVFLAGPPKSGTSSLFRWLTDHPEVCGSKPKETFALMDPSNPLASADRREGVEANDLGRHFAHCPSAGIRVEGTSHTIFQDCAPGVLAESNATAVLTLRRPADRVFSSFRYTRDFLGEFRPELTFPRLVELQLAGDRAAIRHACRGTASAWVIARDLEYSEYDRWVERWFGVLGPERVRVLLFDDLVAAPHATVSALAQRFGLSTEFYRDYPFPTQNRSRRRPRTLTSVVKRLARGVPASWRRSVGRLYDRLLGKAAVAPDDEERATLRLLDEHFRPSVARLASQLDRDLSAWTRPRDAGERRA